MPAQAVVLIELSNWDSDSNRLYAPFLCFPDSPLHNSLEVQARQSHKVTKSSVLTIC